MKKQSVSLAYIAFATGSSICSRWIGVAFKHSVSGISWRLELVDSMSQIDFRSQNPQGGNLPEEMPGEYTSISFFYQLLSLEH